MRCTRYTGSSNYARLKVRITLDDTFARKLDLSPLEVRPAEVYRCLGARSPDGPSMLLDQLILQACGLGQQLLQPGATLSWRSASYSGSFLRIGDDIELNTGDPLSGWQGLERVAISLCSLGAMLEEQVRLLFRAGQPSLAMALDSFGSAAVEQLAAHVRRIVCSEAANARMNVGARAQPGVGRWDLRDQKALYNAAGGDCLGVHISDSFILTPQKSVCFVIPAGSNLKPAGDHDHCEACAMANCAFRKTIKR